METKKRTVSGRKRLKDDLKRKRVYLYLNEDEIRELKSRVEDAGHHFISEYIRHHLGREDYKPRHVNPIKFLNEISNLALAVNKIGNNVNQIAKYCNKLKNAGLLQIHVIEACEEKLIEYSLLQRAIIKKLKEIIRMP